MAKKKQAKSGAKVAQPKPSMSKPKGAKSKTPGRNPRWDMQIGGLSVPGLGTWEGGSFSSRGDLTGLSKADMVGLAEFKHNVQQELPRLVRKNGARDIWRGTEYLTSVDVPEAGALKGDILSTVRINPSVLKQTRISEISKLYQRYTFLKATIHFLADANATDSGSVIGFFSYDVDHPILDDEPLNVKVAAAQYRQRPTKVWQSRSFPFGRVDSFTNLFVHPSEGDEDRLVYQGDWYLFAATDLAASIDALGTIYLEYEVEFDVSSLTNVDEDALLYSALGATAVTDGLSPFGAEVTSMPSNAAFPSNNVEAVYNAGESTFTFEGVPAGVYGLWSNANCRFTDRTTAYSVQTRWDVVEGGLFEDGTAVLVQTNCDYQNGTATDISPARNSFFHQVIKESFGPLVLKCVVTDLDTGVDYSSAMSMRLFRILRVGRDEGSYNLRKKIGNSAVFANNGARGQACLSIQRKRTRKTLCNKPAQPIPNLSSPSSLSSGLQHSLDRVLAHGETDKVSSIERECCIRCKTNSRDASSIG